MGGGVTSRGFTVHDTSNLDLSRAAGFPPGENAPGLQARSSASEAWSCVSMFGGVTSHGFTVHDTLKRDSSGVAGRSPRENAPCLQTRSSLYDVWSCVSMGYDASSDVNWG